MFLRVLAVLADRVRRRRVRWREWVGAGHAPTALAIVLDNSLSSSVVVNGHPLLDRVQGDGARRSVERDRRPTACGS